MMRRTWLRFLLGTLRGRLILGVAAVHAVMMTMLIIDLTVRQQAMLLDHQIEEARALSHTLATSAGGWILADDISGLQELVDAQRRYPEVVFAILVDGEGRVLAATDKSRLGQYMLDLPAEKRQTTIAETSALVDVATPAMVGGRHVGWARVGIGQQEAREKLADITHSGIIYALAAILIGSVIAGFMGGIFTRRLDAVQRTIDAVRSGNRQARSAISGDDEAAVMAREFDSMLDALAERDDELRKGKETYVEITRWLQSVLDAASEVAIIATDANGVISLFNRGAERMLGYRADDMVGKETPACFHLAAEFEERARELSEELGITVEGFRTFVVKAELEGREQREWTYVRRDGTRIRVSLVVTTVRSAQGEITGYLGIAQDITERKQAELALHKLNRELRAISDCNAVLMHAEDEQTLIEEICRIVCDEAGYRMAWVGYAEQDEAKTLRPVAWAGAESGYLEQAVITWADTERGRGPSGRAIRTGEITGIDDFEIDPAAAPWRDAALQRGYRSSITLPLKDENAKTFGVFNIYAAEPRAFTEEERRLLAELAGDLAFGIVALRARIERKQAEQKLQESERRLQLTLEATQIGIWDWNVKDDKWYASPTYYTMLGYEPNPGAADRKEWIERVHPEDRAAVSEKIQDVLLQNFQEYSYEARMRHANGSYRWHQVRGFGIERDGNGKVTRMLGIRMDIHERKLAEEAEHRLNRELRAISNCNQTLMRAVDEQSLLDEICRIICAEAGYCMAWVGYAEHDAGKTIRPMAWSGGDGAYIAEARMSWAEGAEHGNFPAGICIRSGEAFLMRDFSGDPRLARWREDALRHGYRSGVALPLKNDSGKVFGALVIYSIAADAVTPAEMRLLEELAADLAFGITTLRTRVERDQATEQVRIAATAFEAQEGIIITDADQVILRVNRAYTDITGYTAEETVGATPRLLKSGRHDESYYRAMWKQIRNEGSWQGEIWNRRKNGELFTEWLNITAVKNPRGEVTHYVGTMTDITERKAAEREIEHLAFFDLLTDLPNRRLLIDRLQQAMASSARSRRMGALLFIDLDNFKILNDTCGHDVGDQLLVAVANRLKACVRDGDTISRLGGDEFVIMLEDLSENRAEAAAQAKIVGEKVLAALNQPYTVANRLHHSTPSIGATVFVDNDNAVDELLKQADIAMYQAKSAGRNTLRFFDPDMQAAVTARADMEAALRQGIKEGQFVLHYQAQVDSGRRIVGAEALLRWQHPERGLVQPDQFIPLAEEAGLILPIGQWVLDEACARLAAWASDPRTCDLRLAVNVSARQFRQEDFVDCVRQSLERAGAPASRLKLELTETLVLDDVTDTIEKMHALKKIGVGFSMDDFGTGYSSLSYLTRLPLDQLKIDKSFVQSLPDNPNDAVVVQTIITLASSLQLAVIAEGVENEAQRLFLEQHGCPIYQGYLFSKPLTMRDFEKLLARG